MNALAPINFASAYKQLRPAEKAFVDGYVTALEGEAARNGERISVALQRPIPAAIVEASRGMLDRPMVIAAISERVMEIAAAAELSVHKVLKHLAAISFSSVGDYMNVGEDGQPHFDLTKANPDQLLAIQSIDIDETVAPNGRLTRKFKFKLHDKLGGLDKFMRYMGLLEPDNPFWRADTAHAGNSPALPGSISEEGAGDAYSRVING